MKKTIDDLTTDLMFNVDLYFQEGVVFDRLSHESLVRLNNFLTKILADPFYKHN